MQILERVATVVVAAMLAACAKSPKVKDSKSSTDTPAGATAGAGDCASHSAELGKWLAAVTAEGDQATPLMTRSLELVSIAQTANWYPSGAGPTAILTRDGLTFNGENEDLKSVAAKLSAAHGGGSSTLLTEIDGGVRWGDVAALATMAEKAGFQKISFVFVGTSQLSAPDGPSKSAAAQPPTTGQTPGMVYERCPAALDLMPKLAGLAAEEKAQQLTRELPKAIAACQCQVDLAAVRTLHWSWYRGIDRPRTYLTLALATDPKAALLAEDAATSWATASRDVVAAAGTGSPVHFGVH